MEDPLWFVLGSALLILALVDVLWTGLWADGGGGPVASTLCNGIWRGCLALVSRDRHRMLSLSGPVILVAIMLAWVCLMWAGWVLIFASDSQALLHTRDHTPADWTGRIYFVGYTMFTMGNGDFTPRGDPWQIVVALTNASGMLLVTLAVTYLLSVISAVVRQRAFASRVTGLGKTPQAFLAAGWNGRDYKSFDLVLSGLSSELAMLSEQHLSYPVLQYYHSAHAAKSPGVALLVLDDALTLLRYGVAPEARPSEAVLHSTRSTVQTFLGTIPAAFTRDVEDPPPPPELEPLRKAGVPTVDQAQFQKAVEELADRRRRLRGLLHSGGWRLEQSEGS